MIHINVSVDYTPATARFVKKTIQRFKTAKIHSSLHKGMKIQAYKADKKHTLIFGYKLLTENLNKYVGFLTGVALLLFTGISNWLWLPIGIYNFDKALQLLGYWMMYKGLRKEGYKGKIKLISNSQAIERILNGAS